MTPLSLCSFQGRCYQGTGRPGSVTPFGPSEAHGVPYTTSPYMLRPGTREIHVQPSRGDQWAKIVEQCAIKNRIQYIHCR
jgi:hypothetical protein